MTSSDCDLSWRALASSTLLSCLTVLAACAGSPSNTRIGQDATVEIDAGSGIAGQPDFGMIIDDGGARLLADGAIIYMTLAARPCPSDSTLTYENFASSFFGTYCRGCHSTAVLGMQRQGAPDAVNFDNVASIRALREMIWDVAGDSNTYMPAAGPTPTRAERRELGDWLACGARAAGMP